jgi:hypothetical protein
MPSNIPAIALFSAFLLATVSQARAEIVRAKPGDNLQMLTNSLRRGDELVLADGMYPDTSIDFGRLDGVTLRADNVVAVKITRDESGRPVAHGGGVILSAKGKPFALRGGTNVTVRGIVVDGCSNGLQKGAIQLRGAWTIEDVIVQHADTGGFAIDGGDDINRRATKISMSRAVAQDNG